MVENFKTIDEDASYNSNEFKIKSSDFITSASDSTGFIIDEKEQLVFAGRSNAGKSSLINSLLNRKKLAKTSNTPGKTRLVNYFLINENFYFVDLPGYGYASVPKTEREKWRKLTVDFFEGNEKLRLAFSIVDIRHKPTENDMMLIDTFDFFNIPQIVILSKKDKLSNNKAFVQQKMFKKLLADKKSIVEIIPYSSVKHFNRNKVIKVIGEHLTNLSNAELEEYNDSDQ
ncbi:MAG: ribosome biogenesis GTP-binding protein YihA/YsxC [Candidatus Delongbacteria bacterium]|jgi:GTP-binding protein|nr:ribosome biogenesis GTP-binding protein YihA/YsxC [Candidatus Delongbacteria bacterium]